MLPYSLRWASSFLLGQVRRDTGAKVTRLAGQVLSGTRQASSPCFPQSKAAFGISIVKGKKAKFAPRLNTRYKPPLVDSQPGSWDAWRTRFLYAASTVGLNQGALGETNERQHSQAKICRKLCEDGRLGDAVAALELLVQQKCHVHNSLFYRLLKRCIANKDLVIGRRVHDLSNRSGYEGNRFLATHLISLYASHGRLEEAMRVFTKVSTPDAYVWASIIFACARHGKAGKAIQLYQKMRKSGVQPDNRIYLAVLKACAAAGDLAAGRQVHAHILASPEQSDIYVHNGLLDMYAKCKSLEDARSVFDRLPCRNVVTWNTMLSGYVQQGLGREALSLYNGMRQEGLSLPDSVTFSCLLQACASVGVEALDDGKQVHSQIQERRLEEHVVVGCSLVNMYAKCGSTEDARRVFDKLPERNVLTWTSMIACYSRQGLGQEALSLYKAMQQDDLSPPDDVTWMCLLQACASVGVRALHDGKELHARVKEQVPHYHRSLGSSLVHMYAKCGSMEDARIVFDSLTDQNLLAWKAMIAGYVQQGMCQEALSLYSTMQQDGLLRPDSVTFVSLLQACATAGAGALRQGRQLHDQIRAEGLHSDVVLGGSLVNMYAKCGSLEDARNVFDKLLEKNVVTWNAMIAGYAKQGMGREAHHLYSDMRQEGFSLPDSVTFTCLLQACANAGVAALHEGKQLHAEIQEQGLQNDVVLGCSLVNMYAKCGSLDDARSLFDKLPQKDVVTWTTMIAGYARQGVGQGALRLYNAMQKEAISPPDAVTFSCLLQACASVGVGALQDGKQLHTQIQDRALLDVALGGSLVDMYAKCGSIEDARNVFDRLVRKNVVTWTAMVAGYAQQGMAQHALDLYKSMQAEGVSPPNSVTFACLLQSCASVGVVALVEGKQLHKQIEERGLQADVVLGCSLVNMYAKCGSIQHARKVFDTLPRRDVMTWNAMLAGYSHQGRGQEALSLYSRLEEKCVIPNSVTFVCLLQACVCMGAGALNNGRKLHAQIEERGLQADRVLGGSLINMYAKCGSLEDARRVFDGVVDRDVGTWNTMIAGYSQQGMVQESMNLYNGMQEEGVCFPDCITFLCLLQACAVVAALPVGEQLHEEIRGRGLEGDVVVGAALVNMYAKCGSMSDSQRVFDLLPERSGEAWGALIGGYARQGDSTTVFNLVEMMALQGIRPDGVTFLNVLTVCSHAGLVDKGRRYFEAMTTDYGITPNVEHYTCMMDLLGRAGHLDEAFEVAKSMPCLPDGAVWSTLMGACQKWKNVDIGQQAFEFAVTLNAEDAACYVAMSNIYASAQMWEKAKEVRARRAKCGAWKKPGQSWWTDIDGVVHTFVVGDKRHPESDGIYARLENLVPRMRKEGYVPHIASSLWDVPDDEKEAGLCGHSEKLAIAYALNKTPEGTTIRVVKNLRVCEDCHRATAYISKIEKRTIICRDASRFHVYIDGKCSCGDYW